MSFSRRNGELHAEDVALAAIADRCGTPTYVYSRAHLAAQFRAMQTALAGIDHLVCYAVKANGNLAVLQSFVQLGAGFDIVSGGELERVLRAGGDPSRIVFSGVGKTEAEMDFALKQNILCFNVESASELDRLERRARLLRKEARVSVRVNPDIDAGTHPYISTGLKKNKFGVSVGDAYALYEVAARSEWLRITGLDCHIGSQIAGAAPFIAALESLLAMDDELGRRGIDVHHIDIGGGLPVRYRDEPAFDLGDWARSIRSRIGTRERRLLVEPGRFLVANAGVLLCRVEYLKPSDAPDRPSFAVVDAAMNDLIRPPLYQAWHEVAAVSDPPPDRPVGRWDVVGPVCESGDFLALDRELAPAEGDLLAVLSAGAYGIVQSSNYNARNRPAEVLVDGAKFWTVRRRESVRDQLALESLPG